MILFDCSDFLQLKSLQRRKIMKIVKFFHLFPTLLFFFCLFQAEADSPSDEISSGFEISRKYRGLSNRSEFWFAKLTPDGRFVWEGTHLANTRYGCSKRAGRFFTTLSANEHIRLVNLSLDALKEQESLNTQEDHSISADGDLFFLSTEYGESFETTQIIRPNKKTSKKFLDEIYKLSNDIVFEKGIPIVGVDYQAIAKNNQIFVTFKNIGLREIKIFLPKTASSVFSLIFDEKEIPVKYIKNLSSQKIEVLKKNEKTTVTLKLIGEKMKWGQWYLKYHNVHLLGANTRANTLISSSLCEKVELSAL